MCEAMPQSQPETAAQSSRRPVRRLFVALAAVVVALDQVTKYFIFTRMMVGDSYSVLEPVLSFTYSRNTGSAMGLVPAGGRVLAVVAAVFIVGIMIWGARWAQSNRWLAWGLGLLLGGAVGNLIDRVRFGYVVDFLDVHFWPVFNVADIAVCCGAAVILVGTLLYSEPKACSAVDDESET